MRGEGGVTGEGSVGGVPKFYSWDKCTMPLTNINSGCVYNASFGLLIILHYYIILRGVLYFANIYYAGRLFRILGCNEHNHTPRCS